MGASTSINSGIKIGPKLRHARRRRAMSIDQVAVATGLTKGFISQVERDLASASVASLISLCDALGIPIGSLFEPSRSDLIRSDARPLINFGGEGVTEYLLTPSGEGRVQVIQSYIEPGGGGGEELYSLNADAEFVHVVEGELEVRVQTIRYRLKAGDSLTFNPRDPHTWRNPSASESALVMWAMSPSPW
ncbi:MAG: helix-turn-helix domain-containing protein [Actinomycetota bacterium]